MLLSRGEQASRAAPGRFECPGTRRQPLLLATQVPERQAAVPHRHPILRAKGRELDHPCKGLCEIGV